MSDLFALMVTALTLGKAPDIEVLDAFGTEQGCTIARDLFAKKLRTKGTDGQLLTLQCVKVDGVTVGTGA